ncbi:hypothetical protein BMS3Bbin01_01795 [bacterium BMS3Bbin01]|nr:hypothetical protein BMS3Bbin01_01795 [bacterium BMS3Bbin01]
MVTKELRDQLGVGDMLSHPERQRLEAQEQQERVERRQRGPGVAQEFGACLHQVRILSEILPEPEVVVGGGGVGEKREVAVVPRESAALDDAAGDHGAMASDELGGRVGDDIGSVLERPAQVGSGERVVHDEGEPMAVGDSRHGLEIEDVGPRVPDRLPIHGLGAVGNRLVDRFGIMDVHEGDIDTHPAQGHVELGMRAAVQ